MFGRFYFDLESAAEVIRDEMGAEARDLDEAMAAAREVVAELAGNGMERVDGVWTLVIRDGARRQVARLPARY